MASGDEERRRSGLTDVVFYTVEKTNRHMPEMHEERKDWYDAVRDGQYLVYMSAFPPPHRMPRGEILSGDQFQAVVDEYETYCELMFARQSNRFNGVERDISDRNMHGK